MSEVLVLSENPLEQADRALKRIGKVVKWCLFVPPPLLAITCGGFFFFRPDWYLDPFLTLIFVLFCIGQFMALSQMRGVLAGVRKTANALQVIRDSGDEPDLKALRKALLEKAPPGHLRDLLLRWVELGLRGQTHGFESLLDNAWDRRSLMDGRVISLHVSLNRTTLKLGFLGTLIGLIMTFPPMKRAVMSLADSEGEMKFIRDLTSAIDGDEYAILNTLVATAISILIELVTLQILERALAGFDLVNSHINDWNLTRLQPSIRKQYSAESKRNALEGAGARMEEQLLQAQVSMDCNLAALTEAMGRTSRHVEQLSDLQASIGRRISELADFERQYRSFIQSKVQAAAPPHLRREGEG